MKVDRRPVLPVTADIERRRKIVGINAETVTNVTSTDFPGHYPGEDHAWSLEKFKDAFQIQFHKNDPIDASFSLIGIDASLANAFRRILIAEIPTLAIEDVYVRINDSVIADEVLGARLGLVPLTGNQELLNSLKYKPRAPQGMLGEDSGLLQAPRAPQEDDSAKFFLDVKCEWKEGMKGKDGEPEQLYEHSNVYASDLRFSPEGNQAKNFGLHEEELDAIRPVNPRILLAKIRPGDEIMMELFAYKGIGADHAKFSPVATATYRLLPTIEIIKPILGKDAMKFARCFPRGVIGLEEVTEEESEREGSEYEGKQGEKKAVVRNTMRDTVSRECLRHEEFESKVKLGRVRDHFIFSIESIGQTPSDALFIESVRILRAKCEHMKESLADVRQ